MTATMWSLTDNQEQTRPFDAAKSACTKDDELLPSVRHLQRGGDDDPNDHNWDTQIKVACCAQSPAYGEASNSRKYTDRNHLVAPNRSGRSSDMHF